MKTLRTICSLLLMSTAMLAQTGNQQEPPYIEVSGTAEQRIMPDEIYIRIVLREKYNGKEKMTLELQEQQLKTALKEIGVDLSQLALSDANADYVKVKWKTKDVMAAKRYVLKVNSAAMVGKVFQQLDKIEVTDATISSVSHSRMDSLRAVVRVQAIKAAKEKADYLLAAIGEHTGKAQVVREEGSVSRHESNVRMSSNVLSSIQSIDKRDDDEQEIGFQKIEIRSSIYVKFLIK